LPNIPDIERIDSTTPLITARWHNGCSSILADMPTLKRKEVNQMKIATLFLMAVLLAGSIVASSMPARAEDESDVTSSWSDHIQDLRRLQYEQE
jgi:hypothetical protein